MSWPAWYMAIACAAFVGLALYGTWLWRRDSWFYGEARAAWLAGWIAGSCIAALLWPALVLLCWVAAYGGRPANR